MYKLILIGLFLQFNMTAYCQVMVSFHINEKPINEKKTTIDLRKGDKLFITIKYAQKINVGVIKVTYYDLISKKGNASGGQEQPQTMAKMKLNNGNQKVFLVNKKNLKNPVFGIPIDSLLMNSTLLKINIINCTDMENNVVHRNNKSYSLYSNIYDYYKGLGLVN